MISEILNVQIGNFPMKYLRVPLSPTRLGFNDCQPLIAKIQQRLVGWRSKALSYAGRVELIKSTLSTIHFYWEAVFLIPKATLNALDKQVRDFFWNKWSPHYIHPVAWDSICQPFYFGGLNIRSFVGTSKAALLRQLWNVVQNKPTCWNLWLNAKYLKGKSFWNVSIPKDASWG
eukprot:TRINITY_DN10222_c0_g1_i2.p1 TRINITY_DN10222_c0_g1~~TRINITY_DN10222_c0_g1_i2.p1  ORF type:complete len:174 (-),score=27.41 TRINITY_DN10222_c0_g1_i2:1654-2175(-)